MKKSIAIVGCSLITTLVISGCSAPYPKRVSNAEMGKNVLYANMNKHSEVTSITNNVNEINKGFKINDYAPIGYDTSFQKNEVGGCLWNQKLKAHSQYESIESNMGRYVLANIVVLPLTLPFGLMCTNYHIFNFKEFDTDAKTALNATDAKSLLSSYDTLVNVQYNAQNKANKAIEKLNEQYLQKRNRLLEPYKAKQDKIKPKIKIIDKSGLYENENLPIDVKAMLNKIPSKYSIADNINYRNFVNKSFPCKSVSICKDNMKNSKMKIISQPKKDVYQNRINMREHLKQDIPKLKKIVATYQIHNGKTNEYSLYKNKENASLRIMKTLHYQVETPKIIKSSSNSIPTKIIVKNVDYSNIYPTYENQNRDISLTFDNKNFKYTFVNKTDLFIEIKSLSMYYNDAILDLMKTRSDSDNNRYISELPPHSRVTMKLFQRTNEAQYKHITAKEIRNKRISFGFAVKYTKGEQTKNITLFKLEKKPLYPVLKNL